MARTLDAIDTALVERLNEGGKGYAEAKRAAAAAKIRQEQADRAYEEATIRARATARQSLPAMGSNGKPLTVDAAKEMIEEVVLELVKSQADAAYAAADGFTIADAELSIAREDLRNIRAAIELYARGEA